MEHDHPTTTTSEVKKPIITYQCSLCEYNTTSSWNGNRHYRHKHTKFHKKHYCHECDRQYSRTDHYNTHLK